MRKTGASRAGARRTRDAAAPWPRSPTAPTQQAAARRSAVHDLEVGHIIFTSSALFRFIRIIIGGQI
jgi:hypothetical protein